MLTKTDLKQIEGIIQTETTRIVKTEINSLRKEMKKGLKKLERKLDYTINFLNRDYLKLLQRVENIEEHLGIIPTTL